MTLASDCLRVAYPRVKLNVRAAPSTSGRIIAHAPAQKLILLPPPVWRADVNADGLTWGLVLGVGGWLALDYVDIVPPSAV